MPNTKTISLNSTRLEKYTTTSQMSFFLKIVPITEVVWLIIIKIVPAVEVVWFIIINTSHEQYH